MKYFFRFLLALVISAIVVITYASIEAVGNKHSRLGRVQNMTSQESNNSNNIKQSGLQLGIKEPQIIALAIPENKPGATAPLSFTVSITNPTQTPIPFILYDALIPEIIGPDGQALHRKEPINTQVGSSEYSGKLIGVGEQTVTSLEGRLSWQNNVLQLILHRATYDELPIDLDKSWSFDTVGPGEYQIRFIYENPTGTISYFNPLTFAFLQTGQETIIEETIIEVTGTGELTTPFANFRLLTPVEDHKNVVEVDGIRFETFIPKPFLTVINRNKSPKPENYSQIGMRITNNTLTPFYFSFYGTFTPDLVTPDGQVLRGGYNNDWTRWQLEKSDFLLVTPGKSATFFPSTSLYWRKLDQFSLGFSNEYGGWCSFDSLKPGIYQLRFRYESTMDSTHKTDFIGDPLEDWLIEIMKKVWTGRVDTPFVEFHLTPP
ncbi:MAG: hypothetical protein JGK12_30070 [Microcoleus sp. PH2017_01_SCD_O_A]|uniref:hypothetical protein n=1 Tax=unclassified Microcoleus TaxID=2642155 RepID=UPI001DF67779|nr:MULTISPECIES: hypothetical protein [unclassified Microcoleus]MCC3420983.1 hypothetical protein [Microcoleus sp. PH2017_07_MST_O_A]TAG64177.1 MAG: hypothetical protein EAZ25_21635 [Oscillatoriales cyanobacterium]MCC3428051.1 hypothetical protein [Microcoleus sp. PH2017_01_SCD_O_A]MCC3474139.1 hypothetical protein [Microcoleus sp. PH2017_13_LAR_U_A]MCC3486601.1 hypothetical protein [Microcoleus sp. PH2017_14_LAR_D_A]